MLELWQLGILSAVGVIAGWLNVMAGGGSLLTLPVMLAMGLPAPVANGSNRIGVVVQNVGATVTFLRKGYGDLKLGLKLAAVASLGAIAGANVGVSLDGRAFDILLALVMALSLFSMVFGSSSSAKPEKGPIVLGNKRLWLGYLCMVGVGFWGGMIQVGVGFILMPVLHRVLGLDLVNVNVQKVLIVLVFNIVAFIVFAAQVQIYWIAGLSLALGTLIGGWLGAHTNMNKGEKWIRRVLIVTLTVFIIRLLWPS